MTDRLNAGISGARQGLKGTAKVFQGFKDFISRGNAIELAVGVVIGAAFGAVVKAIVDGLHQPADLGDLRAAGPEHAAGHVHASTTRVVSRSG